MLNSNGRRELAYVVTIDEIKSLPGYDRVEYARTKNRWSIVQKDQFKVGDLAVFIEIDSKVPKNETFAFLKKRHYTVKLLRMCKVISQGLLMSPADLGWHKGWSGDRISGRPFIYHNNDKYYEGDFVTKTLGITYRIPKENIETDKSEKILGHFNIFKWFVKKRSKNAS